MERPDGITQEAWDKARDIEFDFDCDWTADGRRSGEPERQFATALIAQAIQSAVEAERERAAKICETVGKRLEGREFSGSVLEVAVREAVNGATHNACVILAKHIRKGA